MSDKNKKPENGSPKKSRRETFLVRLNVAVLLGVMVIATLFMTFGKRPNVSLEENRDLAKCPEFSIESYLSGEFTKNFAAFYNDTVPMRSDFKSFISNFRAHLGIKYDGGVHLEGGPPIIESRPPDTSRPSSSKKPPVVVIPQVPGSSSSDTSSEPSESVTENSSSSISDTSEPTDGSAETSE